MLLNINGFGSYSTSSWMSLLCCIVVVFLLLFWGGGVGGGVGGPFVALFHFWLGDMIVSAAEWPAHVVRSLLTMVYSFIPDTRKPRKQKGN